MSMFIIAGEFRHRQIGKIPPGIPVRPMLARVRKSFFDIIWDKIKGKNFLDLYAGTGIVGIEALSRGAKSTVFIDSNRQCTAMIKSNAEQFGLLGRVKISQSSVLNGLEWLRYKELSPFEVIFLGPPYPDYLVNRTLKLAWEADILGPGGWIVAQHHLKEPVEAENRFRQEKYGDTMLSFYRRPGAGNSAENNNQGDNAHGA